MDISFTTDAEGVDWEEAADLMLRAPLGAVRRDPEQMARAFRASYACVFAWEAERLAGLGRALCDGEYQAAIYDMAVAPGHQGRGLGRELLDRLCAMLPAPNVILYAAPGKQGFYRQAGFLPMRTAMARLNRHMAQPASGYLDHDD